VYEGEYSANIVYTYMKMEKWDLLKLIGVQERKENDEGDEFNFDIFDVL
jgi:hypothetical protein